MRRPKRRRNTAPCPCGESLDAQARGHHTRPGRHSHFPANVYAARMPRQATAFRCLILSLRRTGPFDTAARRDGVRQAVGFASRRAARRAGSHGGDSARAFVPPKRSRRTCPRLSRIRARSRDEKKGPRAEKQAGAAKRDAFQRAASRPPRNFRFAESLALRAVPDAAASGLERETVADAAWGI